MTESIPTEILEEIEAIIDKYNSKTESFVENEMKYVSNISITESEKEEKKESNEDET